MTRSRESMLADLRANPKVQVIVIGGGINGISTFRELALQGVRVLLVDRGDFCGACSSAPSRMIHGGLRYLENGEIGLVRESLRERDLLLRNAPHFVRPLPTTVPIHHVFSGLLNSAFNLLRLRSKPAERGALAVKAGLILYDTLVGSRRLLPKHTFRGRKKSEALWPDLPPTVRFTATYYDAWISHPERLGIELVQDGLGANPEAIAINHVGVTGRDGTRIALKDALTGDEVAVEADLIVNATGAWLDETNSIISPEGERSAPLVGGTKGSHLILDHPELLRALNGHMVYFENVDGRVCIVFPYLGRVLLGSTDIRIDTPGAVRCEDDEVDYVLKSLSYVFPDIAVRPEQIVYRYRRRCPGPSQDGATGRNAGPADRGWRVLPAGRHRPRGAARQSCPRIRREHFPRPPCDRSLWQQRP
jgi:glycerol-3-phosphate dehydrogenase